MSSSSSKYDLDLLDKDDAGRRRLESNRNYCGEGISSCNRIPPSGEDVHLLDLTCTSEESFSFSLPDVASVCEDQCETSMTQLKTTTSDVHFPNFLLCFVEQQERELQEFKQRTASSASSIAQLHLQRQLVQTQRHRQQQVDVYDKLQGATSLCCSPQSTQTNLEAERDDVVFLFEQESRFLDEEEEDDFYQEEQELLYLDKAPPLVPAGSVTSDGRLLPSFDLLEGIPNLGGTIDDPRYVPRPSSTTPSLREFVRSTSSREEDENQLGQRKQPRPWEKVRFVFSDTSSKKSLVGEIVGDKTAPLHQNHLLRRRTRSEEKQTQGIATGLSGVSPTLAESGVARTEALVRSRTADAMSTSCPSLGSAIPVNGEGSLIKKGGKNPMLNLLRRTRLSPFRKPIKTNQPNSKRPEKPKAPSSSNAETIAVADDVVEILASLELTLRTRSQEATNSQSQLVPHGTHSNLSPKKKQSTPQQEKHSPQSNTDYDAPSVQQSGMTEETQTDTSSLDDVFSGVLSDSMEDDHETDFSFSSSSSSSSESSSDDSRCTIDRFLCSPYAKNPPHPHKWSSSSESRRGLGPSHKRYHPYNDYSRPGSSTNSGTSSTSRLSLPSELIRCGSVDTTKASNLGGLGADRARLLDLQAVVWQQQQQELDRLSAPPLDFEAPDGDGVIRVKETVCATIDAACEIEVLPKNFLLGTSKERIGILSQTTAEF
jgi:hypothetical protein